MKPKKRKSDELDTALYLTDEEHDKLIENLEAMKQVHPRNVALIYTALLTGARAQEVLNIRPKDINKKDSSILIRGLKGSNDRAIPVRYWLVDMLLSLVTSPRQAKIFDIKYCQFRNIWYQLSPVDKKLHSLRHTRAMRALALTGDPAVVKTGLGHRSFQSTMVYLNHVTTKEKLKRFME